MNNNSTKSFGAYKLNTINQIDCIKGIRELPNNCADLAIADPPYNLSKGGIWKWDNSVKLSGFGGNWEKMMENWDNMSLGDYLAFTIAWLTELKRIIRPTGSLWVHGTYHNIGIINFAMQLLSIEIINEVIWYKCNSFPNLSGRRLTASHETILWAHTGKRREYFFNYQKSKDMSCPGDGLKLPGKQMRTVWDIANNKNPIELKYGKHPSQKPIRLISRMIEVSAKKGQICVVPFAGSGSECVAAKICGLDFIAFETDSKYLEIAHNRLSDITEYRVDEKKSSKRKITQMVIPVYEKEIHQIEKTVEKKINVPSLIKWTGSKRSQVKSIYENIPPYNKYIEPFLGGGAVLYLLAKSDAVASDIYEPLIELWRLVQSDPEKVVENYRYQWNCLQNNLPDYYYQVRDRFNEIKNPLDLCFLSRTCVNGIIRFNEKGEFNNSFHLSRRGMKPDLFGSIVKKWTKRLEGVNFLSCDYTETISLSKYKDFVYLDPPYAGNKQRYSESLCLEKFFNELAKLNKRGVYWALSFDGKRGKEDLLYPIPKELYKRHLLIPSGNSAVGKVLNASLVRVYESLYVNY